MTDVIEALEETKSWRSRDAKYWAGSWRPLSSLLPDFTLEEFRSEPEGLPNPYMRSVVRQPRTPVERPVPVGIVSNTYSLVQHHDVAELCFEGIRHAGVHTASLRCELGLTELGEWMNLRIYFPPAFDFTRGEDDNLGLRLECYNSVDGSSRLVLLLGWLRFVCTNGLVIGETKTELRDVHNKRLDTSRIPLLVSAGMAKVQNDLNRMRGWDGSKIKADQLGPWVDGTLSNTWGKKAACRVYHICLSGYDVEMEPFGDGPATEKRCKRTERVPGSPESVATLFDVSQALAWVATGRNNVDERLDWQSKVPVLVEALAALAGSAPLEQIESLF
jgi:hypothetical protein